MFVGSRPEVSPGFPHLAVSSSRNNPPKLISEAFKTEAMRRRSSNLRPLEQARQLTEFHMGHCQGQHNASVNSLAIGRSEAVARHPPSDPIGHFLPRLLRLGKVVVTSHKLEHFVFRSKCHMNRVSVTRKYTSVCRRLDDE